MSDWITTTERLIQNNHYLEEFMRTNEFIDSFEEWASQQHPELYGND